MLKPLFLHPYPAYEVGTGPGGDGPNIWFCPYPAYALTAGGAGICQQGKGGGATNLSQSGPLTSILMGRCGGCIWLDGAGCHEG